MSSDNRRYFRTRIITPSDCGIVECKQSMACTSDSRMLKDEKWFRPSPYNMYWGPSITWIDCDELESKYCNGVLAHAMMVRMKLTT